LTSSSRALCHVVTWLSNKILCNNIICPNFGIISAYWHDINLFSIRPESQRNGINILWTTPQILCANIISFDDKLLSFYDRTWLEFSRLNTSTVQYRLIFLAHKSTYYHFWAFSLIFFLWESERICCEKSGNARKLTSALFNAHIFIGINTCSRHNFAINNHVDVFASFFTKNFPVALKAFIHAHKL
jgi:hypothetical protein